MKNLLFIALLLISISVCAEQKMYVTDQIQVMVRSGIGTGFKITNQLSSGAGVILLEKDINKGYSKIRTKNGNEGWILTRYLTDQPSARWRLVSATKKLEIIGRENTTLKQDLKALRDTTTETNSKNVTLSEQSEQLGKELDMIRKTAAHSLQIQRQRDQFQERVINLERELQKVKREKQSLEDSSSQDWFLIGAGVLFAGIFLGLILPRISWRRKTSSWDSF